MSRSGRYSAFAALRARPLIYGHRGARHAAPENTMAAFELAHREGADGVELDTRLSRDGQVIVFHDKTLTRVTSRRDRRPVHLLDAAELQRVDVGSGQGVPLLADVLRLALRTGLRVNVELKSDLDHRMTLVKRVADLVRSTPGANDLVLFSSFDPTMLLALKPLLRSARLGWLTHSKQTVLKNAPLWHVAFGAVHPEATVVTQSLVDRCHRRGGIVNTWTVNDPAEAVRLVRTGIDGIISDAPGLILDAIGRSVS